MFDTALKVYNKFSTDEFVQWHGGKVHDQQVLTALGKGNPFNEFWDGDASFEIKDLDLTWNYPLNLQNDRGEEHKKLLNLTYNTLKKKINFVHFLLSQPWSSFNEWVLEIMESIQVRNFPKGWVVGKKESEPNPLTRIKFVEDWRKEVRKIEKKYECKLFDKFDDLDNIL